MLLRRAKDLIELMESPDADPVMLRSTYERFHLVNRCVARWESTYIEHIRHLFKPGQTIRLLDVGCGAADVALFLRARMIKDGFVPDITLIDPSDHVDEYFKLHSLPEGVRYERIRSAELATRDERFDLVISNHLLHHLSESEIVAVLTDCLAMADRRVIFSDLDRNVVAWSLFSVFSWPVSFGTYIHTDGLRSIRRSFVRQELIDLLPGGWSVHRQFPFRLLIMRDAER